MKEEILKDCLIENKFIIHTEGSHSVRYNSICFTDNDIIIFPCGIYLNVFKISENSIIKSLFIDNSIIYNVQKNENLIIAVCYNGKGALIDNKDFNICNLFHFKNGNTVSNISFSKILDTITISCEYFFDERNNKSYKGSSGVLVKDKNDKYELVKVFKKKENLTEINIDDNLIIIEKIHEKIIEEDEELNSSFIINYKISLINIKDYIKARKEFSGNCTNTVNYKKPSYKEYQIYEKLLISDKEVNFIMKSENKKYIGISFCSRDVTFIDITNLNTILNIDFEGKGFLGSIYFCDRNLYFSNKPKEISKIDLNFYFEKYEEEKQIYMISDHSLFFNNNSVEIKINLDNSITNKKENYYSIDNEKEKLIIDYKNVKNLIKDNSLIHSLNYCLRISPNGKILCWVNESGFHVYNSIDEINSKLNSRSSIIKLTGVGLSINKVSF